MRRELPPRRSSFLAVFLGGLGALTAAPWFLSCSDSPGSQPVVARVDGEEITAAELARELRRLKRENEGLAPRSEDELSRVRHTLLDRLIERRLLVAEARRREIVVSDEEVQQALLRKRAGYPGATFEEEVAKSEMTRAELTQRLREQVLVHRLMRAEAAAGVQAGEPDLRAYYDAHSAEMDQPEQVHARQIVTKTEEHAQQLKDALARGADFAVLARKHSLSPDGKQGGDLGFFARGVMPPVFDEVCFSLQPGKISEVVTSSYGYHLFQVLERRPAVRRGFDEAKANIAVTLSRERAGGAEAALLARLRESARIKVDEEALAKVR